MAEQRKQMLGQGSRQGQPGGSIGGCLGGADTGATGEGEAGAHGVSATQEEQQAAQVQGWALVPLRSHKARPAWCS